MKARKSANAWLTKEQDFLFTALHNFSVFMKICEIKTPRNICLGTFSAMKSKKNIKIKIQPKL